MAIKLIAVDLDGTLLNNESKITKNTESVLREAYKKGIEIVVASGRAYNALPDQIRKLPYINYAITSNGAFISKLSTEECIYRDYIKEENIIFIIELAKKENLSLEIFFNKQAYIDFETYNYIKENGSIYRNKEYVLNTRKPIENLFRFMEENSKYIENINIFFKDMSKLQKIKNLVKNMKGAQITSSFRNNIEIGGEYSSKGHALMKLGDILNIESTDMMAFGNAENDKKMLEFVGIGVAVENAEAELKKVADKITLSNDDEGVATEIEKYL